jgi:hypothetical protein
MESMMTDFVSPVSEWQPDDECEMILTVRNTFLHLEPAPSPSARPARRCGTSPGALLAATFESNHFCARGDGDSSGAHSLREEESEGGTPESGTQESQDGSDGGVVPDEIETRVTIRNTFVHLEPVASEQSPRTGAALRHKTAPASLLAAAFARDSPCSGTEGRAEGREEEETSAPASPPVSRAGGSETDDVVSDHPVGDRMRRRTSGDRRRRARVQAARLAIR